MRIGVLADTHVADILPELPPGVIEVFARERVDLILHAGDLTAAGVLRPLEALAPVVAVQGNHDHEAGLDLPRHVLVRAGGVRIGVTHGHRAAPAELMSGALTVATGRPVLLGLAQTLRRRFDDADCVVFGHLHLPYAHRVGRTLVFSPGAVYVSEADPAFRAVSMRMRLYGRYRSGMPPAAFHPHVGILDVAGGAVRHRLVPVPGVMRVAGPGTPAPAPGVARA